MAHPPEMQAALDKRATHKINLELQLINAEMTLAGIAFEKYKQGFIARINQQGRNTLTAMFKANPYKASETPYQHKHWQDGYMGCDKVLCGPKDN